MKARPTRITKPRTPLRLQSDPQRNMAGTRRRSSRLQSSQRSLGSYDDPQYPLEQLSAEPHKAQLVEAISDTLVQSSCPVEAPAPVFSKTQFQQYLCSSQTRMIIQHPKPLPIKRLHASFLEDSIDRPSSIPPSKRHQFESVITQWLESIPGSESYRERHCKSENLLSHLEGELVPRRLTKSVPIMESTLDPDGFVVPPLSRPSFEQSQITRASTTSTSRRALVQQSLYREMNLIANNVYFRYPWEELPKDIADLVDHVGRDRNSTGPTLDQVRQDKHLQVLRMGSTESDVAAYFKANLFPGPDLFDCLKRTDNSPMARKAVPNVSTKYKISTPIPDMLYGYHRGNAFPQQQAQLLSMGNEMVANNQDLMYPFLFVEFKADGPGGSGSMWVATNQCIGGSATCVNIAERLNHQLKQCKSNEVQLINSAAFSIAMNGTEARLFVSWKHNDLDFFMRDVKIFSLQDPEQFLDFRRHVLNIIEWGQKERLTQIREALDILSRINT